MPSCGSTTRRIRSVSRYGRVSPPARRTRGLSGATAASYVEALAGHPESPSRPLLLCVVLLKTTHNVFTERIGGYSEVVKLVRKASHLPRLSLIVEVPPGLEHLTAALEDLQD